MKAVISIAFEDGVDVSFVSQDVAMDFKELESTSADRCKLLCWNISDIEMIPSLDDEYDEDEDDDDRKFEC